MVGAAGGVGVGAEPAEQKTLVTEGGRIDAALGLGARFDFDHPAKALAGAERGADHQWFALHGGPDSEHLLAMDGEGGAVDRAAGDPPVVGVDQLRRRPMATWIANAEAGVA
ncbi:MAG: hypothetical protein COS34_01585, partial [Lysobacterales bacterium CG02_land_8_20_14_3_00_62_12]